MMAARPFIFVLPCAAMAACAAPVPVAAPATRAVVADGVAVTYRDRAFTAQIAPGAAGITLTRAGAQPVAGSTVRVTAAGLAADEGIAAKEAARLACGQAGGVFQAQAIGAFAGSETWAFAGACA
ncbi:MAG: hypothetical protein ACRCS3_13475 [Paracoccaceae bacterium]